MVTLLILTNSSKTRHQILTILCQQNILDVICYTSKSDEYALEARLTCEVHLGQMNKTAIPNQYCDLKGK